MASAASLGDQLVRLVGRRYHHTPPLVELEAFMSQLRRLVDAGAPLTARITTAFHPLYDEQDQLPVLSYLILQGELDAVMACLRSPHPIDFTAASAIGGSPVLHELLTPTLPSSSSSSSVDTAAAYSKALHLPEGERQMFQTEGAILFTANASTARLWQAAEILTRCKPLLHFGDDVCLPASGEIWMLQKRRANEAMVRGWTDVTEKSVAEGADVMFKSTLAVGCPTLTRLVSEGQLEAALACLETRLPIDFTVTDSYGKTPLHAAAETLIASEAFSLTILRAIRQRLERHPGRDLIEWWQLDDDGKHFLDSAAAHQLLAAFWAEVRGFAAVTGAAAGKEGKEPAVVRLSTPTWQWDWNDMLVQDPTASAGRLQLQLLAEGDGAIRLPGSRATARLWLLMERPREWMEDFIPQMRQCVAEGADLLHQMQRGSPYGAAPLLSHALYAASIPPQGWDMLPPEDQSRFSYELFPTCSYIIIATRTVSTCDYIFGSLSLTMSTIHYTALFNKPYFFYLISLFLDVVLVISGFILVIINSINGSYLVGCFVLADLSVSTNARYASETNMVFLRVFDIRFCHLLDGVVAIALTPIEAAPEGAQQQQHAMAQQLDHFLFDAIRHLHQTCATPVLRRAVRTMLGLEVSFLRSLQETEEGKPEHVRGSMVASSSSNAQTWSDAVYSALRSAWPEGGGDRDGVDEIRCDPSPSNNPGASSPAAFTYLRFCEDTVIGFGFQDHQIDALFEGVPTSTGRATSGGDADERQQQQQKEEEEGKRDCAADGSTAAPAATLIATHLSTAARQLSPAALEPAALRDLLLLSAPSTPPPVAAPEDPCSALSVWAADRRRMGGGGLLRLALLYQLLYRSEQLRQQQAQLLSAGVRAAGRGRSASPPPHRRAALDSRPIGEVLRRSRPPRPLCFHDLALLLPVRLVESILSTAKCAFAFASTCPRGAVQPTAPLSPMSRVCSALDLVRVATQYARCDAEARKKKKKEEEEEEAIQKKQQQRRRSTRSARLPHSFSSSPLFFCDGADPSAPSASGVVASLVLAPAVTPLLPDATTTASSPRKADTAAGREKGDDDDARALLARRVKNERVELIQQAATAYAYDRFVRANAGEDGLTSSSSPASSASAIRPLYEQLFDMERFEQYSRVEWMESEMQEGGHGPSGTDSGLPSLRAAAPTPSGTSGIASMLGEVSIGVDMLIMLFSGAAIGYFLGMLRGASEYVRLLYMLVGMSVMLFVDGLMLMAHMHHKDCQQAKQKRQRIQAWRRRTTATTTGAGAIRPQPPATVGPEPPEATRAKKEHPSQVDSPLEMIIASLSLIPLFLSLFLSSFVFLLARFSLMTLLNGHMPILSAILSVASFVRMLDFYICYLVITYCLCILFYYICLSLPSTGLQILFELSPGNLVVPVFDTGGGRVILSLFNFSFLFVCLFVSFTVAVGFLSLLSGLRLFLHFEEQDSPSSSRSKWSRRREEVVHSLDIIFICFFGDREAGRLFEAAIANPGGVSGYPFLISPPYLSSPAPHSKLKPTVSASLHLLFVCLFVVSCVMSAPAMLLDASHPASHDTHQQDEHGENQRRSLQRARRPAALPLSSLAVVPPVGGLGTAGNIWALAAGGEDGSRGSGSSSPVLLDGSTRLPFLSREDLEANDPLLRLDAGHTVRGGEGNRGGLLLPEENDMGPLVFSPLHGVEEADGPPVVMPTGLGGVLHSSASPSSAPGTPLSSRRHCGTHPEAPREGHRSGGASQARNYQKQQALLGSEEAPPHRHHPQEQQQQQSNTQRPLTQNAASNYSGQGRFGTRDFPVVSGTGAAAPLFNICPSTSPWRIVVPTGAGGGVHRSSNDVVQRHSSGGEWRELQTGAARFIASPLPTGGSGTTLFPSSAATGALGLHAGGDGDGDPFFYRPNLRSPQRPRTALGGGERAGAYTAVSQLDGGSSEISSSGFWTNTALSFPDSEPPQTVVSPQRPLSAGATSQHHSRGSHTGGPLLFPPTQLPQPLPPTSPATSQGGSLAGNQLSLWELSQDTASGMMALRHNDSTAGTSGAGLLDTPFPTAGSIPLSALYGDYGATSTPLRDVNNSRSEHQLPQQQQQQLRPGDLRGFSTTTAAQFLLSPTPEERAAQWHAQQHRRQPGETSRLLLDDMSNSDGVEEGPPAAPRERETRSSSMVFSAHELHGRLERDRHHRGPPRAREELEEEHSPLSLRESGMAQCSTAIYPTTPGLPAGGGSAPGKETFRGAMARMVDVPKPRCPPVAVAVAGLCGRENNGGGGEESDPLTPFTPTPMTRAATTPITGDRDGGRDGDGKFGSSEAFEWIAGKEEVLGSNTAERSSRERGQQNSESGSGNNSRHHHHNNTNNSRSSNTGQSGSAAMGCIGALNGATHADDGAALPIGFSASVIEVVDVPNNRGPATALLNDHFDTTPDRASSPLSNAGVVWVGAGSGENQSSSLLASDLLAATIGTVNTLLGGTTASVTTVHQMAPATAGTSSISTLQGSGVDGSPPAATFAQPSSSSTSAISSFFPCTVPLTSATNGSAVTAQQLHDLGAPPMAPTSEERRNSNNSASSLPAPSPTTPSAGPLLQRRRSPQRAPSRPRSARSTHRHRHRHHHQEPHVSGVVLPPGTAYTTPLSTFAGGHLPQHPGSQRLSAAALTATSAESGGSNSVSASLPSAGGSQVFSQIGSPSNPAVQQQQQQVALAGMGSASVGGGSSSARIKAAARRGGVSPSTPTFSSCSNSPKQHVTPAAAAFHFQQLSFQPSPHQAHDAASSIAGSSQAATVDAAVAATCNSLPGFCGSTCVSSGVHQQSSGWGGEGGSGGFGVDPAHYAHYLFREECRALKGRTGAHGGGHPHHHRGQHGEGGAAASPSFSATQTTTTSSSSSRRSSSSSAASGSVSSNGSSWSSTSSSTSPSASSMSAISRSYGIAVCPSCGGGLHAAGGGWGFSCRCSPLRSSNATTSTTSSSAPSSTASSGSSLSPPFLSPSRWGDRTALDSGGAVAGHRAEDGAGLETSSSSSSGSAIRTGTLVRHQRGRHASASLGSLHSAGGPLSLSSSIHSNTAAPVPIHRVGKEGKKKKEKKKEGLDRNQKHHGRYHHLHPFGTLDSSPMPTLSEMDVDADKSLTFQEFIARYKQKHPSRPHEEHRRGLKQRGSTTRVQKKKSNNNGVNKRKKGMAGERGDALTRASASPSRSSSLSTGTAEGSFCSTLHRSNRSAPSIVLKRAWRPPRAQPPPSAAVHLSWSQQQQLQQAVCGTPLDAIAALSSKDSPSSSSHLLMFGGLGQEPQRWATGKRISTSTMSLPSEMMTAAAAGVHLLPPGYYTEDPPVEGDANDTDTAPPTARGGGGGGGGGNNIIGTARRRREKMKMKGRPSVAVGYFHPPSGKRWGRQRQKRSSFATITTRKDTVSYDMGASPGSEGGSGVGSATTAAPAVASANPPPATPSSSSSRAPTPNGSIPTRLPTQQPQPAEAYFPMTSPPGAAGVPMGHRCSSMTASTTTTASAPPVWPAGILRPSTTFSGSLPWQGSPVEAGGDPSPSSTPPNKAISTPLHPAPALSPASILITRSVISSPVSQNGSPPDPPLPVQLPSTRPGAEEAQAVRKGNDPLRPSVPTHTPQRTSPLDASTTKFPPQVMINLNNNNNNSYGNGSGSPTASQVPPPMHHRPPHLPTSQPEPAPPAPPLAPSIYSPLTPLLQDFQHGGHEAAAGGRGSSAGLWKVAQLESFGLTALQQPLRMASGLLLSHDTFALPAPPQTQPNTIVAAGATTPAKDWTSPPTPELFGIPPETLASPITGFLSTHTKPNYLQVTNSPRSTRSREAATPTPTSRGGKGSALAASAVTASPNGGGAHPACPPLSPSPSRRRPSLVAAAPVGSVTGPAMCFAAVAPQFQSFSSSFGAVANVTNVGSAGASVGGQMSQMNIVHAMPPPPAPWTHLVGPDGVALYQQQQLQYRRRAEKAAAAALAAATAPSPWLLLHSQQRRSVASSGMTLSQMKYSWRHRDEEVERMDLWKRYMWYQSQKERQRAHQASEAWHLLGTRRGGLPLSHCHHHHHHRDHTLSTSSLLYYDDVDEAALETVQRRILRHLLLQSKPLLDQGEPSTTSSRSRRGRRAAKPKKRKTTAAARQQEEHQRMPETVPVASIASPTASPSPMSAPGGPTAITAGAAGGILLQLSLSSPFSTPSPTRVTPIASPPIAAEGHHREAVRSLAPPAAAEGGGGAGSKAALQYASRKGGAGATQKAPHHHHHHQQQQQQQSVTPPSLSSILTNSWIFKWIRRRRLKELSAQEPKMYTSIEAFSPGSISASASPPSSPSPPKGIKSMSYLRSACLLSSSSAPHSGTPSVVTSSPAAMSAARATPPTGRRGHVLLQAAVPSAPPLIPPPHRPGIGGGVEGAVESSAEQSQRASVVDGAAASSVPSAAEAGSLAVDDADLPQALIGSPMLPPAPQGTARQEDLLSAFQGTNPTTTVAPSPSFSAAEAAPGACPTPPSLSIHHPRRLPTLSIHKVHSTSGTAKAEQKQRRALRRQARRAPPSEEEYLAALLYMYQRFARRTAAPGGSTSRERRSARRDQSAVGLLNSRQITPLPRGGPCDSGGGAGGGGLAAAAAAMSRTQKGQHQALVLVHHVPSPPLSPQLSSPRRRVLPLCTSPPPTHFSAGTGAGASEGGCGGVRPGKGHGSARDLSPATPEGKGINSSLTEAPSLSPLQQRHHRWGAPSVATGSDWPLGGSPAGGPRNSVGRGGRGCASSATGVVYVPPPHEATHDGGTTIPAPLAKGEKDTEGREEEEGGGEELITAGPRGGAASGSVTCSSPIPTAPPAPQTTITSLHSSPPGPSLGVVVSLPEDDEEDSAVLDTLFFLVPALPIIFSQDQQQKPKAAVAAAAMASGRGTTLSPHHHRHHHRRHKSEKGTITARQQPPRLRGRGETGYEVHAVEKKVEEPTSCHPQEVEGKECAGIATATTSRRHDTTPSPPGEHTPSFFRSAARPHVPSSSQDPPRAGAGAGGVEGPASPTSSPSLLQFSPISQQLPLLAQQQGRSLAGVALPRVEGVEEGPPQMATLAGAAAGCAEPTPCPPRERKGLTKKRERNGQLGGNCGPTLVSAPDAELRAAAASVASHDRPDILGAMSWPLSTAVFYRHHHGLVRRMRRAAAARKADLNGPGQRPPTDHSEGEAREKGGEGDAEGAGRATLASFLSPLRYAYYPQRHWSTARQRHHRHRHRHGASRPPQQPWGVVLPPAAAVGAAGRRKSGCGAKNERRTRDGASAGRALSSGSAAHHPHLQHRRQQYARPPTQPQAAQCRNGKRWPWRRGSLGTVAGWRRWPPMHPQQQRLPPIEDLVAALPPCMHLSDYIAPCTCHGSAVRRIGPRQVCAARRGGLNDTEDKEGSMSRTRKWIIKFLLRGGGSTGWCMCAEMDFLVLIFLFFFWLFLLLLLLFNFYRRQTRIVVAIKGTQNLSLCLWAWVGVFAIFDKFIFVVPHSISLSRSDYCSFVGLFFSDLSPQQHAAARAAAAAGSNGFLFRTNAASAGQQQQPQPLVYPSFASPGAGSQQQQLVAQQFATLTGSAPYGGQFIQIMMPTGAAAATAGQGAANAYNAAAAAAGAHQSQLVQGASHAQQAAAFPGAYIVPQALMAGGSPYAVPAGSDAVMQLYGTRFAAPSAATYRGAAGGAGAAADRSGGNPTLQQAQQQVHGAPTLATVYAAGKAGPVTAAGVAATDALTAAARSAAAATHDVPLVVKGEFGLDPLFNGVDANLQAWPFSAPSAANNGATAMQSLGDLAARRLTPGATNLPTPTPAAVSALLTYGFNSDTLGLELLQDDPLYPTISALPYDHVERCILPEYHPPESYRKAKPQVLSMKLYNSFSDFNLFYIFYSMPRDVLHIAAARSLYDRNWMYNKKLRYWCKQSTAPSGGGSSSNPAGANSGHNDTSGGMWDIFDPFTWTVKRTNKAMDMKDMEKYDVIKDRMSRAADSKGKKAAASSSSGGPATGNSSAAAAPAPTPPAAGSLLARARARARAMYGLHSSDHTASGTSTTSSPASHGAVVDELEDVVVDSTAAINAMGIATTRHHRAARRYQRLSAAGLMVSCGAAAAAGRLYYTVQFAPLRHAWRITEAQRRVPQYVQAYRGLGSVGLLGLLVLLSPWGPPQRILQHRIAAEQTDAQAMLAMVLRRNASLLLQLHRSSTSREGCCTRGGGGARLICLPPSPILPHHPARREEEEKNGESVGGRSLQLQGDTPTVAQQSVLGQEPESIGGEGSSHGHRILSWRHYIRCVLLPFSSTVEDVVSSQVRHPKEVQLEKVWALEGDGAAPRLRLLCDVDSEDGATFHRQMDPHSPPPSLRGGVARLRCSHHRQVERGGAAHLWPVSIYTFSMAICLFVPLQKGKRKGKSSPPHTPSSVSLRSMFGPRLRRLPLWSIQEPKKNKTTAGSRTPPSEPRPPPRLYLFSIIQYLHPLIFLLLLLCIKIPSFLTRQQPHPLAPKHSQRKQKHHHKLQKLGWGLWCGATLVFLSVSSAGAVHQQVDKERHASRLFHVGGSERLKKEEIRHVKAPSWVIYQTHPLSGNNNAETAVTSKTGVGVVVWSNTSVPFPFPSAGAVHQQVDKERHASRLFHVGGSERLKKEEIRHVKAPSWVIYQTHPLSGNNNAETAVTSKTGVGVVVWSNTSVPFPFPSAGAVHQQVDKERHASRLFHVGGSERLKKEEIRHVKAPSWVIYQTHPLSGNNNAETAVSKR
eukprot:gene12139-8360_t